MGKFLSTDEILTIMEGIKKQYPLGDNIEKALEQVVDQAIMVDILVEENALLKVENEKLKLNR